MKPSQLSLFPTAQADTWRYSDEDACYDCNHRVYDMEKNGWVNLAECFREPELELFK